MTQVSNVKPSLIDLLLYSAVISFPLGSSRLFLSSVCFFLSPLAVSAHFSITHWPTCDVSEANGGG